MSEGLRERIIREFSFHGADVARDYVCSGKAADPVRRADRVLALLDDQEPVAWICEVMTERHGWMEDELVRSEEEAVRYLDLAPRDVGVRVVPLYASATRTGAAQ